MLDIVVNIYKSTDGKVPYLKWLWSIKDDRTKTRIQQRIRRLGQGNFGDCKSLKGGINELRLSFGRGYRIYYGLEGTLIVILLCGGDKATQKEDIEKAKQYWQTYKEFKNGRAHKLQRYFD